ncbi:MAG: carbon storage regulator [Calditrichaeota bacterium]|nr:MAG: carbon storage regulator [Calditrichota bacterium]
MLVLTRKLGQNILIGDDILVKVLKIDHNKVQLGISAPAHVLVYRQELVDKIKHFNRVASRTDHLKLKRAAMAFKNTINIPVGS